MKRAHGALAVGLALGLALPLVSAACSSSPAMPGGVDAGTDAPVACPRVLPTCPASPPSYQQTIAPLLKRKCTYCHFAGSTIAREDFTTYENVHLWFGSMLNQVYGCTMPPSTEPALSDADRQMLLTYLVCMAPDN